MKHIPILYSQDMILAKIAGRKTQTRRIVNPQPSEHHWSLFPGYESGVNILNTTKGIVAQFYDSYKNNGGSNYEINCNVKCPYGQPGDILWTRESWNYVDTYPEPDCFGKYLYKANGGTGKFKPSIHMPKSACRIWDEIVSIRVERVADISEEDAIAEGVQSCIDEIGIRYKDYIADASGYGHPDNDYPTVSTAIQSYRSLWQKINGIESWEANPFVWVISFKPIDKPENWTV